jgi:hypothetical protein
MMHLKVQSINTNDDNLPDSPDLLAGDQVMATAVSFCTKSYSLLMSVLTVLG